MTSSRRALHAILALSAGLGWVGEVHAQPRDPAAAEALFRRGREAAQRGDWATACPKFAESQRLDGAPGTLLNLAACEAHLGRLASARDHYQAALGAMSSRDDRVAFTKRQLADLDGKVPHLTLSATNLPPGTKLSRDDAPVADALLGVPLPLDPGEHTVVVSAPGYVGRTIVVTLAVGETRTVAVDAGVPVAPPRPAAVAPVSRPASVSKLRVEAAEVDVKPHGNPRHAIGVVMGAAGVVGLGLGAVAGALVLRDRGIVDDPNHCNQVTRACDAAGTAAASDGRTWTTVNTVGLAAGGGLLAAGIVVFLTGGTHGTHGTAASVAPDAYPGGAGMHVAGTF
jgi:hypothetical protein